MDLLATLPDPIRDMLLINAESLRMPKHRIDYGAMTVDIHRERLKLAANLRILEQTCLTLRDSALHKRPNSHH
jgi:hypothetical protein